MVPALRTGVLAAAVVTAPLALHAAYPSFRWGSPFFLALVVVAALGVYGLAGEQAEIRGLNGNRRYSGFPDLCIHIHASSHGDRSIRWAARGVVSFLLSLFGGFVGPEGAAMEVTHSVEMKTRPRSSRWFEQRRRTDAGSCVAAGVAAAFGAPFSAILLPAELGFGGRTILIALSSIVAYLCSRLAARFIPGLQVDLAGAISGFNLFSWREWLGIVAIAVSSGILGVLAIRFVQYTRRSLGEIAQTRIPARLLLGCGLLALVAWIHSPGHFEGRVLIEQVLWSKMTSNQAGLLFLSQLLSLALVIGTFGSLGILWPLFSLGALWGFGTDHLVLQLVPGFATTAGLAGAAAFFGIFLNAPLTGSVLAFELTGNPGVIIPCFVAAIIGRTIRSKLGTESIIEEDLRARGMLLIEGRSVSVLDSVLVKEAMVTDHEVVGDHEPVAAIYAKLLKSQYPFLPVVNAQRRYVGLLTADVIQEGWQSQNSGEEGTNSSLSDLLEAKDLLYRSRTKSPVIRMGDKLSSSTGLFEVNPCLPVLDDDGCVAGLLFVYSVRNAYDREVARRAHSSWNWSLNWSGPTGK